MGKKNYILISYISITLLLLALIYNNDVLAKKVEAKCSECHTIHNSEGGSPVAMDNPFDPDSRTNIPYSGLLRNSCVGCHSSTNASVCITPNINVPNVFHTSAPTCGANGLAGGDFYYVISDDNKGHNILGVTNTDSSHGTVPPGGSDLGGQLTCSGRYGCHGNIGSQASVDQMYAIKFSHHDSAPFGGIQSAAKDYRFLLGIKGKEDTDWELDNTNTSHNEYKGSIGFSETSSISYLCYKCHGYFHDPNGNFNFQHKSNVLLPNTAPYNKYTSYSLMTPIARPEDNYTGSPQVVRPGTDIVMCLTCHRAHASPYPNMMRWDYPNSYSGCFNCHNNPPP